MAEAAWEMIEEERRSTLSWPFGPELNEQEREMRRKRKICEEVLAGGDPRVIWDRYEAERQRRKRSRGRRIRFFWETEGGMECIRFVIEDIEQAHDDGDAPAATPIEASDGIDGPAFAVSAGQIREEKEAADADAPAAEQSREMQSAGAVVGGG
jgi:hypothetical protein